MMELGRQETAMSFVSEEIGTDVSQEEIIRPKRAVSPNLRRNASDGSFQMEESLGDGSARVEAPPEQQSGNQPSAEEAYDDDEFVVDEGEATPAPAVGTGISQPPSEETYGDEEFAADEAEAPQMAPSGSNPEYDSYEEDFDAAPQEMPRADTYGDDTFDNYSNNRSGSIRSGSGRPPPSRAPSGSGSRQVSAGRTDQASGRHMPLPSEGLRSASLGHEYGYQADASDRGASLRPQPPNPYMNIGATVYREQALEEEKMQMAKDVKLTKAQAKLYGLLNKEHQQTRRAHAQPKITRQKLNDLAKPKMDRLKEERQKKGRQRKFGRMDDAKNCTFQPKPTRAAVAAMKNPECGYDFIEEMDNAEFLDRNRAYHQHQVKALELTRAMEAYEAKLTNKYCPLCESMQSYDEYIQKRKRCPRCGVEYRRGKTHNRQKWQERLKEDDQKRKQTKERLQQEVEMEREGSKTIPRDTASMAALKQKVAQISFLNRMKSDVESREVRKNTEPDIPSEYTFKPNIEASQKMSRQKHLYNSASAQNRLHQTNKRKGKSKRNKAKLTANFTQEGEERPDHFRQLLL